MTMNCYYCDRILASDAGYATSPAAFDLGSEAPRCPRHWRYVCGKCGNPAHFMATAYCPDSGRLFCSLCSREVREVTGEFWAWRYYFMYESPWTGKPCPGLDRLEVEGRHPAQAPETVDLVQAEDSQDTDLVRYPVESVNWRPTDEFSDDDVRANWNRNAEIWNAGYDDDGDRNRRYQSDEPMLELLGPVRGLDVLDVGCGNGYLCRKLARAGARPTGVELSDGFLAIAQERETQEKLGITYHHGSASRMGFLLPNQFDRAVSNYVLMDVLDFEAALGEVFRVLKPGGSFIVVISHPCFDSGPGWVKPAPDSPRREDRFAFKTDLYFQRGPYLGVWGGLNPVLSFHRPLRDYWQAFQQSGFRIDAFEEPSITERGRRELSPSRVAQALRIPYSCIFRLIKQG
ncbi:MAG: class I SAM-dependent methyltransferase [Chloroflexi bacterium]|nr:class I SAM-dependent methyltransferase [Chloroflexota bacterium]